MLPQIVLCIRPPVDNDMLNALFAAAWEQHRSFDFEPILRHSLLYVCAYHADTLIAFVNVAWDGGIHAFLLDTTVHPTYQKRGIGIMLVQAAVNEARTHGIEWIHVDFEPHLAHFYARCGFRPTQAGLIHLEAT
jgi:GNAT superfamily N-acetyltransferase